MKNNSFSTTRNLLCGLFMILVSTFLSACETSSQMTGAGSDTYFHKLTQANYGAADMLAQQSQGRITRDNRIEIGSIQDLAKPATVSPFGQYIAQNLAARYVQLGFPVSSQSYSEMSGGRAAIAASSDLASTQIITDYNQAYNPAPLSAARPVIITGQYAVAREDVLVNLRMLDMNNLQVLAAYDYSIPLTRDVKKLLEIPGQKKSIFSFGN
jgi:predicted small secreted protein